MANQHGVEFPKRFRKPDCVTSHFINPVDILDSKGLLSNLTCFQYYVNGAHANMEPHVNTIILVIGEVLDIKHGWATYVTSTTEFPWLPI